MDSAPTFKPGIYTDMPFEDYLAVDAFSASCVGPLLESFPARLKDPKPDTRPFKMGRTFHACVLEGQMPGLLHYIVADNFRYIKPDTRAKSKSEHALASAELDESGLTPMKESDMSIDDLTAPAELAEARRLLAILAGALHDLENDDGHVPDSIWDGRNRALALVAKRDGDWTCPECGGDADVFTPDDCTCHMHPPCGACETNAYIRCGHCGHEFEGGWL